MAGYVRTQSTCGSVIHERGLERGTRRIRSRNSIGYAWRGVVRNIEPLVLKVAVCIGGGGYRHVRVVWGAFAEDQRDGLVRLPSLAGHLDNISRKVIVLISRHGLRLGGCGHDAGYQHGRGQRKNREAEADIMSCRRCEPMRRPLSN